MAFTEKEANQRVQKFKTAEIIEAYKQGAKDLLRLNPIDARLESTCVQIWGMKQND
jgi:hypothetical protein